MKKIIRFRSSCRTDCHQTCYFRLLICLVFTVLFIFLEISPDRTDKIFFSDRIYYKGQMHYTLNRNYLLDYYSWINYPSPFIRSDYSANHRATWEVEDSVLYLVKVEVFGKIGNHYVFKNIPLKKLFYDNVKFGRVEFGGISGNISAYIPGDRELVGHKIPFGTGISSKELIRDSDSKGSLPRITWEQVLKSSEYIKGGYRKLVSDNKMYNNELKEWKKNQKIPSPEEVCQKIKGYSTFSGEYEILGAQLITNNNFITDLNVTLKDKRIEGSEITWKIDIDESYQRIFRQLPFLTTVYKTASGWEGLNSFSEDVMDQLREGSEKKHFYYNFKNREYFILKIKP